MRKLILLSTLVWTMVIYITSGTTIEAAESRAITGAKSLIFFDIKKPIGEMIESHPNIERTSVKWFESDVVDGKSIVFCEFSFNALVDVILSKGIPVQITEEIPIQITFAIGRKGGEITQVQSLHPCDGGTHVCVNLGILLKALENKEDLSLAILGYTEEQFVELIEYYTGWRSYYFKRNGAIEKLKVFGNPLSQEQLAELKDLPLYDDYYGEKVEFTLGDFIETISNEQTSRGLKIVAFTGTYSHSIYYGGLSYYGLRHMIVVNIISSSGEESTLIFDRYDNCVYPSNGTWDYINTSIFEGMELSPKERVELMRCLLNVPDTE